MGELDRGGVPGRGARRGAPAGPPAPPGASAAPEEVERLRERVALLEEMLRAREHEVGERLRGAAEESARRADDLARSETALQDKTRILQSILDSMSDGVAVADAKSRLLLFNRAGERLIGLGPVEAPPGDWPGHYGFRQADGVTPFPSDRLPLVRALAGELVDDQELYVARPDGSGVWLSINSRPIRDALGNVVGAVSVLRDVSRRVVAEAALDKRTLELQRSNAELQDFAYVASHDLQEPLRVVRGYADLLARRCRGRLDADAERLLASIVESTDRMMALLGDLLSLSRVGTSAAEPRPCDAEAQCDRALAALRDLVAREGAAVTRGPLPRVLAVPSQLAQVFQNLIANAVKFHDARPPRVTIAAEVRGDEAVLSVRDEGIGIDEADLEKVFGMFNRLHGRGDFPGSGIGLAICRRVVERHGGRIWAESTPGRGSTFRFTLRLAREATP